MNPKEGGKGADSFFTKIEKLSKIQRILIFTGVFVAIIAIFVFVLFKPKLEKIGKLKKRLEICRKNDHTLVQVGAERRLGRP